MFEAIAFIVGYLVGSVPLGLVVARVFADIDIRQYGTGNVGAANVAENVGRFAAALVALGVFLQGLLPPLAARFLGGSETTVVAAGLGSVVGYGWPVFMNFKGGRALGVGTGMATAMVPVGFFPLVATYALGAILRQTSLGTLLGFVVYAAFVFYATGSTAYHAGAILLLILIAVRRLEGISGDLRRGPPLKVFLNRLLFQKRPDT